MPTTIQIVPVGLYNASLARQGVRLLMTQEDGQCGVQPTEPDENVEMQVSDLVNRVVELDQILNMSVDSNLRKLVAIQGVLRATFESGDTDDIDDLIADFKGCCDNLKSAMSRARVA